MDTQTTLDLGPPTLTATSAARRLGLSVSYLNKPCAAGQGPAHHRYGRRSVFHIADLDAYAAAHRVEAAPVSSKQGGEA
ncbi:helix-turn-helix domain-containing protein [Methylobacterium oryzae]|uniref:helix-turn-helix transcriptional regulator n=1 Tax=Methylobacterium oryzae TaxID=334852 RepID=UPI002F31F1A5